MNELDLKRFDEFINKVVMFQSDLQELRRQYAELLESHKEKAKELAELDATVRARRAEHESMQKWVTDLVDKLVLTIPR